MTSVVWARVTVQQVPLVGRSLVCEDAAQDKIKGQREGKQETQRATAVHVQAVTGSWNLDEAVSDHHVVKLQTFNFVDRP